MGDGEYMVVGYGGWRRHGCGIWGMEQTWMYDLVDEQKEILPVVVQDVRWRGHGCWIWGMVRIWLWDMGDGEDMVVEYWGWRGHGCRILWMEVGRFDLLWSRM